MIPAPFDGLDALNLGGACAVVAAPAAALAAQQPAWLILATSVVGALGLIVSAWLKRLPDAARIAELERRLARLERDAKERGR